jgi:hypothetical protein
VKSIISDLPPVDEYHLRFDPGDVLGCLRRECRRPTSFSSVRSTRRRPPPQPWRLGAGNPLRFVDEAVEPSIDELVTDGALHGTAECLRVYRTSLHRRLRAPITTEDLPATT